MTMLAIVALIAINLGLLARHLPGLVAALEGAATPGA